MDIVVVGAGLAGLAAAVSCALAGHHVRIYEKSAQLQEAGAGLQITPNASRLFKYWGIFDELQTCAAEPRSLTVHRYANGAVLAHEPDLADLMKQRYDAPFWDLHRADLQQALIRRAKELGVDIILNAKMKDLDVSNNAIFLENGLQVSADLIVAADGLWSRCRECILKRSDSPTSTGDLAYRIMLHKDSIVDPELRSIVENPTVHFWIGPQSHVVAYSVRGGDMYNIVLLAPDDLPENVARQPGSVDEMRALFQNWDPLLTRFLNCVESVEKWRLMYRPPLDSWTLPGSRIIMIGDASHAMLPYLAQGANLGLEDGAVLGNLMSSVSSIDQIPSVIETFQRLRKPRSEAVVEQTFKQRDDFHLGDGEAQAERDQRLVSGAGKDEYPSRWTCPVVQKWLYGYDAYKTSESELPEHCTGTANL